MLEPKVSLIRRRLLKGVAAMLCLSVSPVGFAYQSYIVAVRVWPSSTYTRVTLESNLPLEYKQFMLSNPDRLVVDIKGIQLNNTLQNIDALVLDSDPLLKKARVGQFDKQTVRLVLELKQDINPDLFTLKPYAKFRNRLVIDLYPQKTAAEDSDDPLLALLKEYNKGDLNLGEEPVQRPPQGQAGKDRPWVIMIDPGHGGEDPGAIGKRGTKEKQIVLQIARRLRTLIQKSNQPRMKAYMTRNDDIFIPLRVRVAKARSQRADLFISIHADAFTNRQANGSSVFALSKKGSTSNEAKFLAQTQNESDQIGGVRKSGDMYLDKTLFDLVQTATINDSLMLGAEVLKGIKRINRLHKPRVEQAGFVVLKAPDIPSILVETAFISNLEEEKRLRSSQFQQQMAQAIFNGIKAYLSDTSIQNKRVP